jgi:hypothetical protein
VAILLGLVRNNDATGLEVVRFKVPQQTMLVSHERRDAVVADKRLREDEDLPAVRWV